MSSSMSECMCLRACATLGGRGSSALELMRSSARASRSIGLGDRVVWCKVTLRINGPGSALSYPLFALGWGLAARASGSGAPRNFTPSASPSAALRAAPRAFVL